MRNIPGAAFRRAKLDQAPGAKVYFAAGACLLAATWACTKGVDNYKGYLFYKRLKEEREAQIQSIQANPNYKQNGSKEERLRSLVMERDSHAEMMKPYKWTARFVQMFSPKG